jgi:hypothetical protein
MIGPVAICHECLLDVTSEDIRRWAEDKRSREWWDWQVFGLCELCSAEKWEREVKK